MKMNSTTILGDRCQLFIHFGGSDLGTDLIYHRMFYNVLQCSVMFYSLLYMVGMFLEKHSLATGIPMRHSLERRHMTSVFGLMHSLLKKRTFSVQIG